MENVVYVRSLVSPPLRRKEILRYAGVGKEDGAVSSLLEECYEEIVDKLTYKVCYRTFPITDTADGLSLGFMTVKSQTAKRALAGCHTLVLFAATLGGAIDRLIARYGVTAPSRALMLQAIGTERIEGLCDAFMSEMAEHMAKEGNTIRPRISAGYGDLPLAAQKNIFSVLDCPRNIGLSLTDSLLMSPTKSVTALFGIEGKGI